MVIFSLITYYLVIYIIPWFNGSFLVGSLKFGHLYLEKTVVTKFFGRLVIYRSFSTSDTHVPHLMFGMEYGHQKDEVEPQGDEKRENIFMDTIM